MSALPGSVEMETAVQRPARWDFRIWRVPVSLFIIAGLLFTVWWWRHPHSYHLADRYPAYDSTLIPCVPGFLVREKENVFVFRDWKGQTLWRVVSAPAGRSVGMPRRPGVPGSPYAFAVSPNGSHFAVAVKDGRGIRLQTWDGYSVTGDLRLPYFPTAGFRVRVLDSGRTFVWTSTDVTLFSMPKTFNCRLVALEGGKVIATGRLPFNGSLASISPDGRAIAMVHNGSFTLAELAIKGGAITPGRTTTSSGHLVIGDDPPYGAEYSLFAGGIAMDTDGTVYDVTGRRTAGGAWGHDTIAPGGRYTLQQHQDTLRVYSPVTGDQWEIHKKDSMTGDATWDGRYALVYSTQAIPSALRRVMETIPGLERFAIPNEMMYVSLYERPGRLRAAIRVDTDKWWRGAAGMAQSWWYPSSDGHGIAMVMGDDMGTAEVLLFRW